MPIKIFLFIFALFFAVNAFTFKSDPNQYLFDAIEEGDLHSVKKALKKGGKVNAQKRIMLTTPLHIASQKGYLEIVKYLVKNGANVNAQTYMKKAPLHLSVINGHLDVSEYLLKNKANINVQDIKNLTPLWYAVQGTIEKKKDFNKYYSLIQMLIEYKSDVNACDYLGDSILKHFKEKGTANPKVLKLLEDNRAVSFTIFKKDIGKQLKNKK